MVFSILIRIAGVLLLIGAVYLYSMYESLILSLGQRIMLVFGVLIMGGFGFSCAFMGDLPIAAVMTLGMSPFVLIAVLQEYLRVTKLLKKLRKYEALYRQAEEEGDEDKMVDMHALAHSCRNLLGGVKEAQDENDPILDFTLRW